MTNTTDAAMTWTQMMDARTEARLHYLAGDLSSMVDRGEITAEEANETYERTATRWMSER